jgi:hypothetical protein
MRQVENIVLSLGLGLFLTASSASATSLCEAISGNLVLNCGFDMGSTPLDGGEDPTDWTASQFTGFEEVVSAPVNGTDSDSMQIANDEFQGGEPLFNGAAIMSQSFTDVSGEHYTFDFYIYNGAPDDAEEQFQAFWGSSSSPTSTTPLFVDTGSLTNAFTLESFTVTGTGSDTITFTSYNTPSYYYLADVSLVPIGVTATPEPRTIGLMGVGLMLVILVRRRRTGRAE